MSLLELLLVAVGLSMDAFSVAICKGLALRKATPGRMAAVGLWFGGFQALMPVLGFLLCDRFAASIARYDHWIILVLLCLIGGNMIREALDKDEEKADPGLDFKSMLLLAVATSIDALAVGVTFGMEPDVQIVPSALLIGATTFVISFSGVIIGNVFGARWKDKAQIIGGVMLILVGLKILLEGLGVFHLGF